MKEKEFMNGFLLGETFNHDIYGIVKPVGIPSNIGMVKVYSSQYLKDIDVNIMELSKIDSTFKYTDLESSKNSSKTS